MQTLSNVLDRLSNWKILSVIFILYIFCVTVLLKNAEHRINELAQKNVGIIDLTFGFNPQKTLAMVGEYGNAARVYYVRIEMTADVIYPIVYTSLFIIILSLLFRNKNYSPFKLINLFPFVVMIFDFLENITIVNLLKTFPNTSANMTILCEIFKMGKWISVGFTMILVLYGLMKILIMKLDSKV